MTDKQLSRSQSQEKGRGRMLKKEIWSFVEKISLFAMMVIGAYIIGSQLEFRITTKTGEWYDYTILLVLGILSVVVGLALLKEILTLLFGHRQKR